MPFGMIREIGCKSFDLQPICLKIVVEVTGLEQSKPVISHSIRYSISVKQYYFITHQVECQDYFKKSIHINLKNLV